MAWETFNYSLKMKIKRWTHLKHNLLKKLISIWFKKIYKKINLNQKKFKTFESVFLPPKQTHIVPL